MVQATETLNYLFNLNLDSQLWLADTTEYGDNSLSGWSRLCCSQKFPNILVVVIYKKRDLFLSVFHVSEVEQVPSNISSHYEESWHYQVWCSGSQGTHNTQLTAQNLYTAPSNKEARLKSCVPGGRKPQ